MKKAIWIVAGSVVIATGVWAFKRASHRPSVQKDGAQNSKAEASPSYWTCPMHPQIHAEHPGECPICHMKLIQVRSSGVRAEQQADSRASVRVASDQLDLLSVQRFEVEKMTIVAMIPISGRYLSSNAVAFQIYESDLRYIKPGLSFKGESSFYPEEEVDGVISSVDSIVDPTSRTVRAVGVIGKGPRGVASETGFRGEIKLELKDRVAIPESSVLHTGNGDLVYLFGRDNVLTAKNVKLGLKSEGFYEVRSGLSPGDAISSGPNFLIDSEAKIRASGQ